MQSIQSRLKSRRILGVGEAADGQLHRSKISQILGNDPLTNSQIASSDYPIGLQGLQWISCVWFSSIGLVGLFSPNKILPGYLLNISDSQNQDPRHIQQIGDMAAFMVVGMRMYGAAMLGLASLCLIVTFGNWQSRRAIRITLLVEGIFCLAELIASLLSGATYLGYEFQQIQFLNAIRIFICVASVYYFKQTRPYLSLKRCSD